MATQEGSSASASVCPPPAELELTENDIEGAHLSDPLDSHTMEQLKWWLVCHGCAFLTNDKKKTLIERVTKARSDGCKVIDVDGTYLDKKRKRLVESGLDIPPLPLQSFPVSGWQKLSPENPALDSDFPSLSQGTLYTYLAEGVGNAKGKKAFRALKRGYVHFASGRVSSVEVQNRNQTYTFIRSTMIPSMRAGTYKVTMVLKKEVVEQEFVVGSIVRATCDCAAGLSASCVHISALLHALVALKPSSQHDHSSSDESQDEPTPCTSKLCAWNAPRKRKVSAMRMSDATFEKFEFGKQKKYSIHEMETFDPRPERYQGQAKSLMPELLERLKGKGLCISLLLDPSTRVKSTDTPELSKSELLEKVQELKRTLLYVTEEQRRKIEFETRAQHQSQKWFDVRRFRLTSSKFGLVRRLKDTTPPDNLVLQILGVKNAYGHVLDYGRNTEEEARGQYVEYQNQNGHPGLFVAPSGFFIHPNYTFLGASPDGSVYDPSSSAEPYGFLEIKCSFKYQDLHPREAARKPDFWCAFSNNEIRLKENHIYYSQVQGQMAVGGRQWCDFCTHTKKGIHIERIAFNKSVWDTDILPKLVSFYDCCVAPEIISPKHSLGIKLRDLRHESQ